LIFMWVGLQPDITPGEPLKDAGLEPDLEEMPACCVSALEHVGPWRVGKRRMGVVA